jgi:hypothetical protein
MRIAQHERFERRRWGVSLQVGLFHPDGSLLSRQGLDLRPYHRVIRRRLVHYGWREALPVASQEMTTSTRLRFYGRNGLVGECWVEYHPGGDPHQRVKECLVSLQTWLRAQDVEYQFDLRAIDRLGTVSVEPDQEVAA